MIRLFKCNIPFLDEMLSNSSGFKFLIPKIIFEISAESHSTQQTCHEVLKACVYNGHGCREDNAWNEGVFKGQYNLIRH